MTPDFLAGLLIGSFGVYACWLLSLRLEPRDPMEGYRCYRTDLRQDFTYLGGEWVASPTTDPIGDALVFLGGAFPDDR